MFRALRRRKHIEPEASSTFPMGPSGAESDGGRIRVQIDPELEPDSEALASGVGHLRALCSERPQHLVFPVHPFPTASPDVIDATGQRPRVHAAPGTIRVSPFSALPRTLVVVARSFSQRTPVFLLLRTVVQNVSSCRSNIIVGPSLVSRAMSAPLVQA